MKRTSLFSIFLLLIPFLVFSIPSIGCSEESSSNGYFWEKLTKNEKSVYVIAYISGFNKMNRHVRDMLDVAIELEKPDVAEYATSMKKYYEENFRYYDVTLAQLLDGIDSLYSDYKNKTIRLSDAFHLVQTEIKGADQKKIVEMKRFMRKSDEEQIKEIINKMKKSQDSIGTK